MILVVAARRCAVASAVAAAAGLGMAEARAARGAQTSRLQALRTLRHTHTPTPPPNAPTPATTPAAPDTAHSDTAHVSSSGGGGTAGRVPTPATAAAGLGCSEAPLACVLPLHSGEQPVGRVVPSPSGQSATVIFADSTAQVHKLLGCALPRASTLPPPPPPSRPAVRPHPPVRVSLVLAEGARRQMRPRCAQSPLPRSGSVSPVSVLCLYAWVSPRRRRRRRRRVQCAPLALGSVTDACGLSIVAHGGDVVVTTGVATSLLTRLRVWSVSQRRALPLDVQMPDGIVDGGGALQATVPDELLLPAPAFGVKLAGYGDPNCPGAAMVALRSAVHGRAWVWRLELDGDGGETAVARLRLARELGGTAKEHSAAALLLGGPRPRLVLGGAAGVRWWTQHQQGAGADDGKDAPAAAAGPGDGGCFVQVREQVPLRRRDEDDTIEAKGEGERAGDGGAAEQYYDDSDEEDDVRSHCWHRHHHHDTPGCIAAA
jgi:hypothetical protein